MHGQTMGQNGEANWEANGNHLEYPMAKGVGGQHALFKGNFSKAWEGGGVDVHL